MELQPEDKEHHHPRTSAPRTSAATGDNLRPPPEQTSTSSSVPALRFPKPQGSRLLANWISSSSPDLLQLPTMSDTSSLADSAYEIITGPSTDSEEHEAALTESVSSLEVSRPDDIHSLDGSEGHYNTDTDEDEDGDSDASSSVSSLRFADQVPGNPPTPPTANDDTIELSEETLEYYERAPNDRRAHYTQGHHVVREFSDEETATLAKDWGMPKVPKRLAASISQTMYNTRLSIQEPLRVLYVGPSEPKRDIILKLGSAIWVSPVNDDNDEVTFGRYREGVYNIVPISSFGSNPELDLMEASHYQIKVDHCTSISVMGETGSSEDSQPQYSVTIGHDTTYEIIVPEVETPSTKPKWQVPHIAVFFIPEVETEDDKRTRELAIDLAKHLKIESVFISESQSFVKPISGQYIDIYEWSPHISLRSLDPDESIPQVRLPIDLASFLHLDARQVNRNLAYLTGLYEPLLMEPNVSDLTSKNLGGSVGKEKRQNWPPFREQAARALHHLDQHKWRLAVMMIPIIMSLILASLGGFSLWGIPFSGHTSSLSRVVGIAPSTAPVVTVTSTSLKAHTSTTTVVINVTSTKTVELGKTQPSTSTLASALSFAGFLSDKPSIAPAEAGAKKTVCSASVVGTEAILIKVPWVSKEQREHWLSKGAVNVSVWRREESLDVRLLSSVDEGILASLEQNGHGLYNVTVVTKRKPKMNETFPVDFGRPMYVEAVSAGIQALYDLVSSTTNDAVHIVEDTCAPAAAKLRGEANSIKEHIVEAGKAVQGCYEESVDRVKRSLVPEDVTKLIKDTKDQWSQQLQAAKEAREIYMFKAQIASKLWWLRLQGKTEEYAEYERNASQFLTTIISSRLDGSQPNKGSTKALTCSGLFSRHRCAQQAKPKDTAKESGWKKKIMG